MDDKYRVPAIERAHLILKEISLQPSQLKLIDLSRSLGINKSSMYSLLLTLENLGWVEKDTGETYRLGRELSRLGHAAVQHRDLNESFHKEASLIKLKLGESLQLARLDGNEVLYLAKEEALTPVRLASGPGMRLPAHATALGKVMLADLGDEELDRFYRADQEPFPQLTEHSIVSLKELKQDLEHIRQQGFALDLEEAVIGFNCAAAPIRNSHGKVIAAVSCSMMLPQWQQKKQICIEEVCKLAHQLSE
ncbi:IclR family transcriptional regulator [Paenibacillus chondroitinus]|uniref:IclR family transcriptional regulator n=1 Tax=Paenibacillus chondroitinus TaxID=59842 RepID=A0ABU6DI39_9BACL|nr:MULTISPECIES: IclR family transcriptional regulator [Paenibacillus]MCY9657598.1 IclR family transcriptional regulator [Paenibacillus anseongense]MEB4797419.1 IclR family transcriptional regulator [Paenibacillus chondroitinus]